MAQEFRIRYGRLGLLLGVLGLGRRWSRVALTAETLDVRLGWAFGAAIPLTSIRSVERSLSTTWSVGAHTNFRGSWLVNGSGDGIVWLDVEPPVRARSVVGVTVRRLGASLEEPDRFVLAMTEVMSARKR